MNVALEWWVMERLWNVACGNGKGRKRTIEPGIFIRTSQKEGREESGQVVHQCETEHYTYVRDGKALQTQTATKRICEGRS